MNRKLLYPLVFALALAAPDSRLGAVPSGETVQENAERVFSRPEFSRLKKMRRSRLVREDVTQRGNGQGGENGDEGDREDRREGRGENDFNRNNPRRNNNDFNRNQDNADNPRPRRGDSSFTPSASFGDFGAGMAGLFKILGILMIAVMFIVIVVLVIKAIRDRESLLDAELAGTLRHDVGELEVDHPPSEYSSEEYLRRAEQFARQGAFREAVAFVLLGAMSEVESRGFIRYRKGLTQRDYYRTVRRHDTIGPAYKTLLKIYEPLGFGRRSAELKHYQTAVKSFRGGFRDRIAISEV